MKAHLRLIRLPVVAAVILGFASARAAEPKSDEISFVARTLLEANVEGPDVERTYFIIGGKRMVFGTPKGCRLTVGDKGLLILLNEAGLDGEIQISRSSFTPETELAANALKYRDAGAKKLPGKVTDIKVQQPMLNVYPYNGWKSLGFTWTYSYAGRSMVRSVCYVNLDVGIQLEVTTLASAKDAEKVGQFAQQFMSSWWVMPDRG